MLAGNVGIRQALIPTVFISVRIKTGTDLRLNLFARKIFRNGFFWNMQLLLLRVEYGDINMKASIKTNTCDLIWGENFIFEVEEVYKARTLAVKILEFNAIKHDDIILIFKDDNDYHRFQ